MQRKQQQTTTTTTQTTTNKHQGTGSTDLQMVGVTKGRFGKGMFGNDDQCRVYHKDHPPSQLKTQFDTVVAVKSNFDVVII